MNYSEILQDIIGQESTTTFWSGKGIVTPEVYRLEKQNQRFYYSLEPIQFYTSITTWIKKVMPTPYFLMEWIRKNGVEFTDEKMNMSSNFGTCEHIAMSLLLREGEIDLSKIDSLVDIYWEVNGIKEAKLIDELATKDDWVKRLQNDLICIIAFVQEKNFTAHAIEWVGTHDATQDIPVSYGCAIDLIGEIDYNGGRKTAIIDLKTGGLYQDQGYQLLGNLAAWKQHNPGIEIDLLYNFKPGNCTSQKKYDLKPRKIADYRDNFYDYAKIAGRKKFQPKPISDYGVISRECDLSGLVISPEQYILNKHNGVTA